MARRIDPNAFDPFEFASRRVAILGYGNQGRAQALNLRESHVELLIGQRPGASFDRAVADGFAPIDLADATLQADVLMLTLPDESMGPVFRTEIEPHLRPGQTVLFSHGFAYHYQTVVVPPTLNVALVSPKGQARGVRQRYLEGSGVPALLAVGHDADGRAWSVAVGYAHACGYARTLLLETTFREETETDLFGEQAVLCGGMLEIIKMGFETLVEKGYDPEMAYFECVHETKLIIDLLVERGLKQLREAISDTAEWGGYQVGPLLATAETRERMREALARIQSGEFAQEWIAEAAAKKLRLRAMREAEASHGVEQTGAELRPRIIPTTESPPYSAT